MRQSPNLPTMDRWAETSMRERYTSLVVAGVLLIPAFCAMTGAFFPENVQRLNPGNIVIQFLLVTLFPFSLIIILLPSLGLIAVVGSICWCRTCPSFHWPGAVLLALGIVLSALWYVNAWKELVDWWGISWAIGQLAVNLIWVAGIIVVGFLSLRRKSYRLTLLAHWLLILWLCSWALPSTPQMIKIA